MDLKKDFFSSFAFRYSKGGGYNDRLWLCSGRGSGFGNEAMLAARDRTESKVTDVFGHHI